MDSNEIFASLKGGGALQLMMGSAAEERSNGWSEVEDEADTLLSLVGGWRLDEFTGGVVTSNGHITNGTTPNGITTNGVSNGVNSVPANVSSCVIHAMPHLCWCEVCSKGLCRACSQVNNTI